MSPNVKENFVRVTYSNFDGTVAPKEKAVRRRLESDINAAIDRFHNETPAQDGLLSITLYPDNEKRKRGK
jgi:hypothetical protein